MVPESRFTGSIESMFKAFIVAGIAASYLSKAID